MEQPIHDHTHGRGKVIFGLAMAILLCSTSQLCWKYATTGVPEDSTALHTLLITFTRPSFWIAAGLYIWQFFNWMMVLKYADLSFAQPITAASYVVVGVAAWLIFKNESLPPHRLVGIALILAGVILISQSPHRSAPHVRSIGVLVPAGPAELEEHP
jgi:drug/metabolite transporter (DMT)-like permease